MTKTTDEKIETLEALVRRANMAFLNGDYALAADIIKQAKAAVADIDPELLKCWEGQR